MSSGPIEVCSVCGQSYWSMGVAAENGFACPACQAVALPVGLAPSAEESRLSERPRFVSLSALPPEKRLPPRREGTRPGLMVPRRLVEVSISNLHPPEVSPVPPSPPQGSLTALPPPLVPVPQLGFNCPSCFTVLIIKDPGAYDGRPAPCPYCRVSILPPRVAQPSPFTLIATPPESPNVLSPPRPSRWKKFGRLPAEESATRDRVELA